MGDCKGDTATEIVEKTKQETITSEKQPDKKAVSSNSSQEKIEKVHDTVLSNSNLNLIENKNKNETVEKPEIENDKKEKIPIQNNIVEKEKVEIEIKAETKEEDRTETKEEDRTDTEKGKHRISESEMNCLKDSKGRIVRNQSDIFSLKDVSTTLQTSIFSVNGCPSRRVFRKQEPAGHVFQRNIEPPADKISSLPQKRITKENYNDEKRPSSSYRNPLTGTGLSSNDEYKSKGIKRKDGNPLLGLGYDSEINSTVSQQRIPPGGYSHKLW